MAQADPFSQVARGQEGTGAAFLLGGNKAAEVFNQQMSVLDQRRRAEAFQRQKALQDQQAASAKFISDVKIGQHWQNDNKEIQDFYDKNINQYGTQLVNEGKNPHTDQTFLSNVQKGTALASYSKQAEDNFNKFYDVYSKEPDKIENGQAIINYYTQPLSKRMESGVLPPTPVIKYTDADGVKQSGGTIAYKINEDGTWDTKSPDIRKIVSQAEGSIGTPASQYRIRKLGGVTDEGYSSGFPVISTDKEGNVTGKDWATSGKKFEDAVLSKLMQDPDGFETILQREGYDISSTEKAIESALDFGAKQNNATGTYIEGYKNTLLGRSDSSKKRSYAAAANARADRSEGRAIAKENDTSDPVLTYRQNWINEMFDGVEGSGERLQAALKGNGSYDGELKIQRIKSEPTKIVFMIPDKVTESTDESGTSKKVIKGRTVTFDKNKPDDKIAMNQLISDITKENVNISQLMTEGGKKKVSGGSVENKMKSSSKDALNGTLPKKGDMLPVKGGTAVYNGVKWVMK